ncbi:MAG: hypothetical protein GX649_15675 [Chloroflexi bacterium]|nr:hypothetical protein [Chloroflexota bacterium]
MNRSPDEARGAVTWALAMVGDAYEGATPPGWSQPAYIGWVPVSAILKGSSAR